MIDGPPGNPRPIAKGTRHRWVAPNRRCYRARMARLQAEGLGTAAIMPYDMIFPRRDGEVSDKWLGNCFADWWVSAASPALKMSNRTLAQC